METIKDIVREIRAQQNGNIHTISAKEAYALADRIEAAIKQERESLDEVIREIGGCCCVRVNCCKCDTGEEIFFVPKWLITKLQAIGAINEQ